ncbi:unnamed protein product [Adineta steineri]|uniref:Uncharacterized protein n=1 Tax=Adineta steineri TaxID=433720 RepID=A0A814XVZ6_9BILA|nr:unnamed protein product [Adineta steineri]CAF1221214.1 unnamed protein product [Adineta steineri]CAF3755719.1 unnamed protein product [Adineta steineri]CAF3840912.1 unnamed protein product [Adineta steineri]CAF3898410.1 unnamed protein product [Adineta steineri]
MSRKQSKHKSIPISSAPINTKQKRQQTNNKLKTPILTQQKVTLEVISNSNKQQQHNTNIPAIHVHNPVNNHQKQKIKSSLTWSNRKEIQGIDYLVKPSSTLLATAPNDISVTSSNQFQWEYSHDEQQPQTSTIPNDFPLYDPCNINDVDEMDALDKEIEDFKKCYIGPCFIRQS